MLWHERAHNGATMLAEGLVDGLGIADNMPSVRTLSKLAASGLGAAQSVLGFGMSRAVVEGSSSSSASSAACSSPQLSCQNTSAVSDLCCFNSPGGAFLQTQFWDTHPVVGPSDSWTIHGLWPDNCDGTYEAHCDDRRAYTNITEILHAAGRHDLVSYMNTYWQSNSGSADTFWQHEWGKHGTCISTLDPRCYASYQPTEEVPEFFEKVVSLFKELPSYRWLADAGITPDNSKRYTLSDIQSALASQFGGKIPYVGCASGALDELWYFYNVRGSLQSGDFVPVDALKKSNCPSTGITYRVKGNGASPTSTTTGGGSQPTSNPGEAFSGSGYLNVISGGSRKGCIISGGTWYTTGTCATMKATASGDGFTLQSSKGGCGVVGGALRCGSGVTSTVFTGDSNTLRYRGSSAFSADRVPSGSTQAEVYSGSSHSAAITIQWARK